MYPADYHLHTNISDDSPALLTEQASAAISIGLQEICVTDHFNFMDQLGTQLPHTRDWSCSLEKCRRAREVFGNRLNIRLGIEVGNGECDPDAVNAALSQAGEELDFVIGSLHNMSQESGGLGIFTAAHRAESREDCVAILDDYFNTMEALVKTDGFDVLGHVIYPLRYLPAQYELNFDPYWEQLRHIFHWIIDSGRGIEVNTSQGVTIESWIEVLKHYKDCGGEIITMGSDAHRPHQVGAGFSEMRQVLLGCGFRWQAVYRQRRPWLHHL